MGIRITNKVIVIVQLKRAQQSNVSVHSFFTSPLWFLQSECNMVLTLFLQDNQNIAEPVASIHLDPLLVYQQQYVPFLESLSLQIGTEGHYRVSPLGPALDLFDSMNNAGMSSNMQVGSMNNYNGYGHESTYASPHTINQVYQVLHWFSIFNCKERFIKTKPKLSKNSAWGNSGKWPLIDSSIQQWQVVPHLEIPS